MLACGPFSPSSSTDLIDDHEGISGHEQYESELAPMYFVRFEDGVAALRLVVMRRRKMRLERASDDDVRRLASALSRASAPLATSLARDVDGALVARPR